LLKNKLSQQGCNNKNNCYPKIAILTQRYCSNNQAKFNNERPVLQQSELLQQSETISIESGKINDIVATIFNNLHCFNTKKLLLQQSKTIIIVQQLGNSIWNCCNNGKKELRNRQQATMIEISTIFSFVRISSRSLLELPSTTIKNIVENRFVLRLLQVPCLCFVFNFK